MPRTLALLAATGCFKDPPTVDFGDPDGLAPLEDVNLAPEVPGQPGDPFPEDIVFVAGEDEANDRYFAHGRAWVHADCGEVWAALRVHEVMVDRRGVDEWTVTENVVPEFDFSFLVHNVVHDVLTIDFDLTWVHQLQEGTVERPDRVVARFDKTAGSGFLDVLSASVVMNGVDDGLCELELIEHMRAALRDEEVLVQYLTDLHTDLVASVHGEPLPIYAD